MSDRKCIDCGLLPTCRVGQHRAKYPELRACVDWRPGDDQEAARMVEKRLKKMAKEARGGKA